MSHRNRRPLGYYVIKAVRITGWLLLALMALYIVSGYALAGMLGCDRLMGPRTAEGLHITWKLDRPLVVLLAVHAGGAAWLAMRRWGWIGNRKKPSG